MKSEKIIKKHHHVGNMIVCTDFKAIHPIFVETFNSKTKCQPRGSASAKVRGSTACL